MDTVVALTIWIPGPAKFIIVVVCLTLFYLTRPNAPAKTKGSWSKDYPEKNAERLNPKESSNA